MKRLFFVPIACLIALCPTISAFAAETDRKSIDVSAKYVNKLPWKTATPNRDGTAKITLTDGTEISVGGIADSRRALVVDVIDEQEATEYINGLTERALTDQTYLHIFLLDENGAVYSAEGMTVAVRASGMSKNPAVCALSNGTLKSLNARADGSALSFTATDDAVYILGTVRQNTSDLSKTGETGNLTIWFVLLFIGISCVCLIRTFGIRVISRKK